ncbi:hypothetical protein [Rothia amarae]
MLATPQALIGLEKEIEELGLKTLTGEKLSYGYRHLQENHRYRLSEKDYAYHLLREDNSPNRPLENLSRLRKINGLSPEEEYLVSIFLISRLVSPNHFEATCAASALSKVLTNGEPRPLRPRMTPTLYRFLDSGEDNWDKIAENFLYPERRTSHRNPSKRTYINKRARLETLSWLRLIHAQSSQDEVEVQVAQTSLAWLDSNHENLSNAEFNSRIDSKFNSGSEEGESSKKSLIIHGTHAYEASWWRPGNSFFNYLNNDINMHLRLVRPPYSWSGRLRQKDRLQAGQDLADLSFAEPFYRIFAHSYGCEVATHAINKGADVERLVLMSAPVTKPLLATIQAFAPKEVWDIRLKLDPVLLCAGVQQRLVGGTAQQRFIPLSHVNTFILPHWCHRHSETHDPQLWKSHRLDQFIQ